MIAFVSNSSFIDGNTADGVRLTWAEEFSDIYVYDLHGNARTQGTRRQQEGGNVFGEGSRTGVAITVLVKRREKDGEECKINYAEIADYLARQEKLDELDGQGSIAGTGFEQIIPNSHGDWLNQRDDRYLEYQPIGDKNTKCRGDTPAVFRTFSNGLKTNRDAWCYNFSTSAVSKNMYRMIANYNSEVEAGHSKDEANNDPSWVSWGGELDKNLERGVKHEFYSSSVQSAMYRPFSKQAVYFARSFNERAYQLPQIFSIPEQLNLAVNIPAGPSAQFFMPLLYDLMPALTPNGGNQIFPLYT